MAAKLYYMRLTDHSSAAARNSRLIGEVGFDEVHVETLIRTVRFAEPTPFVRMNTMALVGMSRADNWRSTLKRYSMKWSIQTEMPREVAIGDFARIPAGPQIAQ